MPELLFDHDDRDCDIVYVPSQTIDAEELVKLLGFVHYEERPLLSCLLRLSTYESARCVFVTSSVIPEEIVEYYLSLCAQPLHGSVRDRLLLLSLRDDSPLPLTQKLLESPPLLEKVRQWVRPEKAFLRCIISTPLEEKLAQSLGIPLRANPSHLSHWGTKHGSRQVFSEAKIPLPPGSSEVFCVDAFKNKIEELWMQNPSQHKYVAKLNDGVSGDGNAIFYLHRNPHKMDAQTRQQYIEQQLNQLEFVCPSETWAVFQQKIEKKGGLVEVWIEGEQITSPSAQGMICSTGEVRVLSTHEQILDGGSLYLGCTFPCRADYRHTLQEYCHRIGQVLANNGAKERYAVDFVVVPNPTNECEPDIYAIEINLRSGGTTHPYETARLLCRGEIQPDGSLRAHNGKVKHYRASDNVVSENFRMFTTKQFAATLSDSEARWDATLLKGCVFYCMGALREHGKVGMLAIGDTEEEACSLYEKAVAHLSAAKSGNSPRLPTQIPVSLVQAS